VIPKGSEIGAEMHNPGTLGDSKLQCRNRSGRLASKVVAAVIRDLSGTGRDWTLPVLADRHPSVCGPGGAERKRAIRK